MNDHMRFGSANEFREWLESNHTTSDGIWVLFSKTADIKTVRAGEALEEALCFGWIDGLIKKIDETAYIKYFARRRKKSKWLNRCLFQR